MNSQLDGKSIVVTGGAGFIGSHIVDKLLQYNIKKVRIVDNLSTGKIENIEHLLQDEKVEFIKGDLIDKEFVTNVLKGMDMICHQAAIGSVPRSLELPYFYHENNVMTFLNLIECARIEGIKRIVYASSSSVYGDSEELPKREENIGKCLSIYATTKYMNECDGYIYSTCFDMEIIGLRYFNIFGPRQNPEGMYAAVIPKFIEKIVKKEEITINGDGTFSRDFTYVDNAVYANLLALTTTNPKSFGSIYNVASSNRVTLNNLVKMLGNNVEDKITINYGSNRKGDIPHSFAKIDKIKKELDYKVLVPFEEGLQKTFSYFKKINTKI